MVSNAPGTEPPAGNPGLLHFLFRRQLQLETETCLFILVNVLDYFLTFILLWLHIGRESNPVARWFLEGWGLTKGLLLYKLALVGLVCGIAQFVAYHRLQTARRLLIGCSCVVLIVVVYSARLLAQHHGVGSIEEAGIALPELVE